MMAPTSLKPGAVVFNYVFRNTLFACALGLASATAFTQQQTKISSIDLSKVQDMLRDAYKDTKKNYFDPKYQGVNIDALYQEYNGKLGSAGSLGDGMRMVAAFLDAFKDSHLFFIPPPRPYMIESGFRMQMIGDQCFITEVRPQTDAVGKLSPGDRVAAFNSFNVNRDDIWQIEYNFNLLNPRGGTDLGIQAPDGTTRQVSVKSIVKPRARVVDLTTPGEAYWDLIRRGENEDHASRSIVKTVGDVTYWKMPGFNLDIDEVQNAFAQVRKHSALVLDLRGNGGGYTTTLALMVGSVFDHDVKIADRVARKDSKPMIAKKVGTTFKGKIVVLVDAGSASAAELFARTMQLEQRGTVIGDRSSGSVMEAKDYQETSGVDTVAMYAFSITDANLIMSDGKSLEKTGVTPDEIVLPTAKDLAAGLDPVLARASSLAGGSLSPEEAGKMFPVEWLPLK
jgi:C-terminal processing protease CtpA/Prc